jgi:hypothetical protein
MIEWLASKKQFTEKRKFPSAALSWLFPQLLRNRMRIIHAALDR